MEQPVLQLIDARGTSGSKPVDPGAASEGLILGLVMALAAYLLGFAVEITHGQYDPTALQLLTAAIGVCITGVLIGRVRTLPSPPLWAAAAALALLLVTQVYTIVQHNQRFIGVGSGATLVGALALAQGFKLRRWRWPVTALTALVFVVVASRAVTLNWKDPHIDVFMFQQMSADGLLHGLNPYAQRFPSLYPYGTPYYGREVIDRNNQLLFGFPYPPLSLLLVLPGYLIGADVRLVDALAVAVSVVLMVAARPGRWAGLVAAIFLLTPRAFFVIERSWTEPLLVLTFSLTMFCALRWRRGLPIALGLFFATKQYTVLAVPLVWLLTERPAARREFVSLLAKAAAVAVAVTLPFFLWDPREFFRAVVQYQFLQPFRPDALSYLAWLRSRDPRFRVKLWMPLVGAVPALPFALWGCRRTPAGFAAAVTVVFLMFFAFNKQAFCNYYYFEIATACWAAVAATPSSDT